MVGGMSPDWLPPGFDVKVKYKDGKKIKYYLNVATGVKYRTKKDVIECATANNKVPGVLATEQIVIGLSSGDKAETALVKAGDSYKSLPSECEVEENTRHKGSRKGSAYEVDDVDNPSPDAPQDTSKTNKGSTSKRKQKAKSFRTVDVETTVDDELPPGWIKEIKTSKSVDNKIRKDPFYIDPVSSYVFRSKKDVLRYLETNDITKCAMRPLKRELCDLKKNDIPSSNPATEKSRDYKKELFIREESIDGRETSATKNLAESDANVVEHTPDINASGSVEEFSVGVAASDMDPKTVAVDATICSPVIDPLPMKQEFTGNGTEKRADKTQVGTRAKKRKGFTLPSRSSKRLAGHEPEMQSDIDMSKRNAGAAARPSVSDVDPFPSLKEASGSVHPTPSEKETADAHISKEPLGETEPVDKIETPISEKSAAEKQLDGSEDKSQESHFFSIFGESWSDPTLEFAIKTLRGEIPIEETLKFSSCFSEPLNHNLGGGGLKSMQPQAPINFHTEFLPRSDYFKQPGSINHAPVNLPGSLYFKQPGPVNHMPVTQSQIPPSSMSAPAPGSISFSTSNISNGQSSTDAGEKGLLRKP